MGEKNQTWRNERNKRKQSYQKRRGKREKIDVRRKISKSKRMREKPEEIGESNDLKGVTQRNEKTRS